MNKHCSQEEEEEEEDEEEEDEEEDEEEEEEEEEDEEDEEEEEEEEEECSCLERKSLFSDPYQKKLNRKTFSPPLFLSSMTIS